MTTPEPAEPYTPNELVGIRQALPFYEPDSVVARLVATVDLHAAVADRALRALGR